MFKLVIGILLLGSMSQASTLKVSDYKTGKVYKQFVVPAGSTATEFSVFDIPCTALAKGPSEISLVDVACDGGRAIIASVVGCGEVVHVRSKDKLTDIELICRTK